MIDGRTLSHEVSENIRLMAVRRVREGERPSVVVKSDGLCRTPLYRWWRAERAGGEAALKARRHPGRPCQLTDQQKQEGRRWIGGQDPRPYGLDFGRWTRRIVADLMEQRMHKTPGLTAVGRTGDDPAETAAAG